MRDPFHSAAQAFKSETACACAVTIPIELFVKALNEALIQPLRAVQASNIIYRKLKISIYREKPTNARGTLSTLRRYKNFSFTFPSGTVGILPESNLRTGAIYFSLYPETATETASPSIAVPA
mgnify:CR=1 FL=1